MLMRLNNQKQKRILKIVKKVKNIEKIKKEKEIIKTRVKS